MDFRPLFITGMFRSGTTLLARMLNAHPQIALASDPFLPFLKHLRDELAGELFGRGHIVPQAPLNDYFADADGLALRRAVESASFDRALHEADRARLWPVIQAYARPFSEKWAARIDEVRGGTYRDAYLEMLRLIGRVYGRGGECYLGHKEVWAGEFTAPLHRAFPEMKSIHVVRDPRAVCASKNVAEDRYPWLFLVRQWRKLASLAWIAVHDSPYRESCLLVRYEDLAGDAEAAARRVCAFLGMEFHPATIDPGQLEGGDGQPWQRNSSYADLSADPAINDDAVQRWQSVLNHREVEFIEQLTFPLMHVFSYQPLTWPRARLPDDLLWNPPQVRPEQLTEWIRPFVRLDQVSTTGQMAAEAVRLRLLANEAVSDELIDSLVYDRALLEVCRDDARSVRVERPVRRRKLTSDV